MPHTKENPPGAGRRARECDRAGEPIGPENKTSDPKPQAASCSFVDLVEAVAAKIAAGGKVFHSPGKVQARHSCLATAVNAADETARERLPAVPVCRCPNCGEMLITPRAPVMIAFPAAEAGTS